MSDKAAQIAALEQEIAQIKRQWPAHSVSPTLLQRLEELEDELADLQESTAVDSNQAESSQ